MGDSGLCQHIAIEPPDGQKDKVDRRENNTPAPLKGGDQGTGADAPRPTDRSFEPSLYQILLSNATGVSNRRGVRHGAGAHRLWSVLADLEAKPVAIEAAIFAFRHFLTVGAHSSLCGALHGAAEKPVDPAAIPDDAFFWAVDLGGGEEISPDREAQAVHQRDCRRLGPWRLTTQFRELRGNRWDDAESVAGCRPCARGTVNGSKPPGGSALAC